MVWIAYYTELNVQIWIYRKNNPFVAKIVDERLTKVFLVIFALAEMLPTSTTLRCKKGWLIDIDGQRPQNF